MLPPPPHFLSCYSIHKSGESLYSKIALVLPPRSDWNSIPGNVLHPLVPVCFRRSYVLLAECHRHFEVDLVGVDAILWLSDYDGTTNPTGKVERRQAGDANVYNFFKNCPLSKTATYPLHCICRHLAVLIFPVPPVARIAPPGFLCKSPVRQGRFSALP